MFHYICQRNDGSYFFLRHVISLLCRLMWLSVISLILVAADPLRADVFIVNSGNDVDDGACNGSHCSFREAINASNGTSGLDEIHFALPGAGPYVITGTPGFPQITDSVVIDGYTQPGADRQKGHPNVVFTGDYWSGLIISAPGVTVRGLVIQGFNYGLRVVSSGAVIQGSFIGTNIQGTSVAGTGNYSGIWLQFADGALVGGPAPGDRNLVSGNMTGVYVSSSTGVMIQGNLIGVDLSGRAALPNQYGINFADDSYDCIIGGPNAGEGNLVAGNSEIQVRIGGGTDVTAVHRSIVQGNIIGTDRTGTLEFGRPWGIGFGHAVDNVVGGPNPREGNVIAFNAKGIFSSPASGNSFFGNKIFVNNTLFQEYPGIDLQNNGVSPNDHCDLDALQNFPDLTSTASDMSSVTINGQLDSVPDQEYIVEFFASKECDPLGYGEGESYLGRSTVVTDTSCAGTFAVTLPIAVPDGMAVTATATGPDGSTSEFSACIAANGAPGSGVVPDGTAIGTTPLMVFRESTGDLTLTWSPSCFPNDVDYEVYGGTIGAFYDHQPVTCTTSGQTTYIFTPAVGDWYYLVVPTDGSIEGSYGESNLYGERPQVSGACTTKVLGPPCP